MTTKNLLPLALLVLAATGLADDWVWTPESGWTNRRYAGRATVGPAFDEAKALHDAGRHEEAARSFDRVLASQPVGRLREDTLFYAAESNYESGRLYRAHLLYDQLLNEFPGTRQIRTVAEREYRIGMRIVRGQSEEALLFKVSSKEEGVEILRRVLDRYPSGELADDARFTIANFYFEEGRYLEALEEYKSLREDDGFRDSEWRDVALFQIARCEEAEYQGPSYDTSVIEKAERTYEEYERADPEGSRITESKERRGQIGDDLAEADLIKARWYLQWDRPQAARVYLRDILELHPQSRWAEEASELLSEVEGR